MANAYRLHFTIDTDYLNPYLGLAHIARVLLITTGHMTKQLTRHAYPGQPSTRTQPPITPCCCQYMTIRTFDGYVVLHTRPEWQSGMSLELGGDVGRELEWHVLGPTRCPVISLFQISSRCPHHAPPTCPHDWINHWDGSLGYRATDQCMRCGEYRPTPTPPQGYAEQIMRDPYDMDDDERRG